MQEEICAKLRQNKKNIIKNFFKKCRFRVFFGNFLGPLGLRALNLHTHNHLIGTHVLVYEQAGGSYGLGLIVILGAKCENGSFLSFWGVFSRPVDLEDREISHTRVDKPQVLV